MYMCRNVDVVSDGMSVYVWMGVCSIRRSVCECRYVNVCLGMVYTLCIVYTKSMETSTMKVRDKPLTQDK